MELPVAVNSTKRCFFNSQTRAVRITQSGFGYLLLIGLIATLSLFAAAALHKNWN